MRLFSLTLSLTLSALFLYSQTPYQVFRPGVQYLYHNSDLATWDGYSSISPFVGMKVESTECHTTYETLRQIEDDYCMRKAAAFAGTEVCQIGTATHFRIGSGSDSLVTIYPGASVGQSWTAFSSTDLTIYARVEEVVYEQVLDVADSVKYIALYDSEPGPGVDPLPYSETPIKISREYGLVNAIYFQDIGLDTAVLTLAGISNPEMGIQNSSFESTFTLETGDALHIHRLNTYFGSTDYYYILRDERWTVTDLATDGDGNITYYFAVERKEYFAEAGAPSTDTIYSEFEEALVVNAETLAFLNEQPGALYGDGINSEASIVSIASRGGNCPGTVKRLETPHGFMESIGLFCPYIDALPGYYYYEGLAGPYYSDVSLGGPFQRTLVYYNTAAMGECGTPYDFVVGTEEAFPLVEFDMSPNPATETARLQLPPDIELPLTLNIHNLQGQEVFSKTIQSDQEMIRLEELPAGIYQLLLRRNGHLVGVERLVVH